MRRRTATIVVIASIAFTAAARISYSFLRFENVERHFREVKIGASRSHVINILGEPNYYSGKCDGTKDIHTAPRNCALDYVYSHPAAPYLPDYYVVSFSSADKVVAADRVTSP